MNKKLGGKPEHNCEVEALSSSTPPNEPGWLLISNNNNYATKIICMNEHKHGFSLCWNWKSQHKTQSSIADLKCFCCCFNWYYRSSPQVVELCHIALHHLEYVNNNPLCSMWNWRTRHKKN